MRYRHKKRGSTYTVISDSATMQDATLDVLDGAHVVVYRSDDSGMIYVREAQEFQDGRFEKLPDDGHIVNGAFQSDKYPTTPPGKVPLSVHDITAQDLLWEYAQRRRGVDPKFADDLEIALRSAGFEKDPTKYLDVVLTRPPGPDSDFVELENDQGRSVARGAWVDRGDQYHVLRLTTKDFL